MWAARNGNKAKPNGHDAELSLLGKNARFKGDIIFEGTARIDGRLNGDISTEGILVIGEEAVVEGNIIAGTVICVGGITGDIIASERVELIAPAVFKGRVKTPCLSLQEGVSFLGASEVQSPGVAAPGDVPQVKAAVSDSTAAVGVAERQFRVKRLIPTAQSGAA